MCKNFGELLLRSGGLKVVDAGDGPRDRKTGSVRDKRKDRIGERQERRQDR